MIEFYDTIQFAFGRVHHGIMTKSKILHLDLGGLGLSLFANFKLYIFFVFILPHFNFSRD
jgi:hypothetical protein